MKYILNISGSIAKNCNNPIKTRHGWYKISSSLMWDSITNFPWTNRMWHYETYKARSEKSIQILPGSLPWGIHSEILQLSCKSFSCLQATMVNWKLYRDHLERQTDRHTHTDIQKYREIEWYPPMQPHYIWSG